VNGRRIATVLGAVLAPATFLVLSLKGVDLPDLASRVRHANWLLLLAYVATSPLHLLLRSWRWRSLLAPVRPGLPLAELFSMTAIGYVALLLPGRVGEIARPALLNRRLGVPFAPALATIGIERVALDLLAVLMGGAVALLLPPQWSGLDRATDHVWLARMRLLGGWILAFGLLALVGTHWMGRERVRVAGFLDRLAQRMPGRILPAVLRWLASLMPGLATLSTARGMVRIVGQTVLTWTVIAAGVGLGIAAAGVRIPPAGVLILLPILALGISLPVPGGTGTYHLAMKLGLVGLFGVDATAALGAAVVVHAFNWLPLIFMGSWCLLRRGLAHPGALAAAEAAAAATKRPT
jgi:hypothetical protein